MDVFTAKCVNTDRPPPSRPPSCSSLDSVLVSDRFICMKLNFSQLLDASQQVAADRGWVSSVFCNVNISHQQQKYLCDSVALTLTPFICSCPLTQAEPELGCHLSHLPLRHFAILWRFNPNWFNPNLLRLWVFTYTNDKRCIRCQNWVTQICSEFGRRKQKFGHISEVKFHGFHEIHIPFSGFGDFNHFIF